MSRSKSAREIAERVNSTRISCVPCGSVPASNWADETEIPEHLRLSAHAFVPPEAEP